jgi:tetratricopeptide (TPR) repeat protein
MNPQSRAPIWMLLAAMVSLIGAGAIVLWREHEAPPSLEGVRSLARQRQFAQAQALMTRYLGVFPADHRAHLLMAQLAMDRPDPQPEYALEHLHKVRPDTPKDTAMLRFFEGKAYYQQKRYDLAESFWKQALDLDPTVPEAGWALLDLLDLEARVDEAHRLGMRIYQVEPDPRDRIRALLELTRLDIDKVAPGSQVQVFEPLFKEHPENLSLALIVGLALIHDSRPEEGIEVLRVALRRHPDSVEAWDGWLTGLDDGHQPELLGKEFARLPKALATDPRFAKHAGAVAQAARNWPAAVQAYRRAYALEPWNGVVLYRLRMALRAAGENAESERINQLLTVYQTAYKQTRPAYTEALAVKTLGLEPHPRICQRMADLREKVGRFDEARLWHRLVLRDDPGNALSLAALKRLE